MMGTSHQLATSSLSRDVDPVSSNLFQVFIASTVVSFGISKLDGLQDGGCTYCGRQQQPWRAQVNSKAQEGGNSVS